MSAMLESFDMQILEYTASTDIDIQMHPTSDPWAQDEAQMEEDGPVLNRLASHKGDPSSSMKSDSLGKDIPEIGIEIDMQDYAGDEHVEYEMLDAVDNFDADPDILDVEVLDASHAHTPTYPTTVLEEPKVLDVLVPQHDDGLLPAQNPQPSEHLPQAPSSELLDTFQTDGYPSAGLLIPSSDALSEINPLEGVQPSADATPVREQEEKSQLASSHLDDTSSVLPLPEEPRSTDNVPEHHTHEGTDEEHSHWNSEDPASSGHEHVVEAPDNGGVPDSDVQHPPRGHQEESDDCPPSYGPEGQPKEDINATSVSTGDPHEISEGVYIDPPPPVLLSLFEGFNFSLFNQPADVDSQHMAESQTLQVIFEQSPTLFYEPLDTVFEALKHEEVIQSLPGFPDSELVLHAVDLGLSLSEDNVHSRNISLHDLNMLHDSLSLQGRLRIKVYTGDVRFLSRYHTLQDQISRIALEVQSSNNHLSPALEAADTFTEESIRVNPSEQNPHETATSDKSQPGLEVNEIEQPPATYYSHDAATEEPQHQAQEVEPSSENEQIRHSDVAPGADQLEESDPRFQGQSHEEGDSESSEDGSRTLSDHEAPSAGADVRHQDINEVNDRDEEELSTAAPGATGEDEDTSGSDNENNENEAEEPLNDDASTQYFTLNDAHHHHDVNGQNDQDHPDVVQLGHEVDSQEEEYEESYEHYTSVDDSEALGVDQVHEEQEAEEQHDAQAQGAEQHDWSEEDDDHNSVTVLVNEQPVQLELPSEPLEFGDEDWNDELDGEGDIDGVWEPDSEIPLPSLLALEKESDSSPSSSKPNSKRNYDQVDVDEDEESWDQGSGTCSPGSKRSRLQ